jgi:ribonuclease-3
MSRGSRSTEPAVTGAAIEAVLDHGFVRRDLLQQALTHRSALGAQSGAARRSRNASNERLEFLGDRVLGLLIAEWLVERFPDEREGEIGRRLAQLVSGAIVARVAELIGLSEALAVAPGEARAGVAQRATVLADAMEAVIGAIYLDGGLDAARRLVRRAWDAEVEGQAAPPKDPKTALQEWALARGQSLPRYEITSRSGPSHAPEFQIRVSVAGLNGTGVARTKRAAERAAAEQLLAQVG